MGGTSYKYQQIAAALRRDIDRHVYQPGDRLPSEQVLAQRFHVNHLTMRQALGLLARDGQVVKRWRSGTFVAGPVPAPTEPRQVAYVGPLEEHGYQALYLSLTRIAQDVHTMVAAFDPTREGDDDACRLHLTALLHHCALVVTTGTWAPLVLELGPPQLPVTIADIHFDAASLQRYTRPLQAISVDWQAATRIATERLLELGHRRIALLDTIDNQPKSVLTGQPHPTRNSAVGYAQALHAAGIDDLLLVGHRFDHPHGMGVALDWMLEQYGDWPTAFVCEGDFRAGPLTQELRLRGFRVPEDISIIGVGDTPWCQLVNPALTSVNLGEDEIARLALLIGGQQPATDSSLIRVTPRLVERISTSPTQIPCEATP